MDGGKGYTIKQAAEIMKVSPKTIRRKITKGEIRAEKRMGPYGETWILADELVHDAVRAKEITLDTVAVKRSSDATAIALVVAEALQQRDDKLLQSVNTLTARVEELTAKVEELTQPKPSFLERIFGGKG